MNKSQAKLLQLCRKVKIRRGEEEKKELTFIYFYYILLKLRFYVKIITMIKVFESFFTFSSTLSSHHYPRLTIKSCFKNNLKQNPYFFIINHQSCNMIQNNNFFKLKKISFPGMNIRKCLFQHFLTFVVKQIFN